jgi:hypothetical protein
VSSTILELWKKLIQSVNKIQRKSLHHVTSHAELNSILLLTPRTSAEELHYQQRRPAVEHGGQWAYDVEGLPRLGRCP